MRLNPQEENCLIGRMLRNYEWHLEVLFLALKYRLSRPYANCHFLIFSFHVESRILMMKSIDKFVI